MKTLSELIKDTKGKFFSISFVKKDGTTRTINGKNRYNKLIKSKQGDTPSASTLALKQAGYVSFVNRNTEGWASAHKDHVLTFKCGNVEEHFTV